MPAIPERPYKVELADGRIIGTVQAPTKEAAWIEAESLARSMGYSAMVVCKVELVPQLGDPEPGAQALSQIDLTVYLARSIARIINDAEMQGPFRVMAVHLQHPPHIANASLPRTLSVKLANTITDHETTKTFQVP